MLSKIEEKRSLYTQARLNPDTFQDIREFYAALQAIDMALFLILSPKKKLAKRSAIEEAQLLHTEELESLKQQIISHPNFKLFSAHEKQKKFEVELEMQGNIVHTDEQLLTWLESIIPQKDPKLANRDSFRDTFIDRIWHSGSFDGTFLYGDYERYTPSGNILGILDMRTKWDAYIIIVNSPYGYTHNNILLYALHTKFLYKKPPIQPSIVLSDTYLSTKNNTNNTEDL